MPDSLTALYAGVHSTVFERPGTDPMRGVWYFFAPGAVIYPLAPVVHCIS